MTQSVQQKFATALDVLVDRIREDRSILSAILCGSLSHDTVWAKSDIDLVLVTIDDKKPGNGDLALYADGVNVHTLLIQRSEFRKIVEGSIRNSFMHSFLANGRLLYTHDETIAALCAELHRVGERDTQIQLFAAGMNALPAIYKAHKWMLTRGDLEYTALWILNAASGLAKVEVLEARLLLDREALPQAMQLNPRFFRTVYSDLLNTRKTRKSVEASLAALDDYIGRRAKTLFAPVLEHLKDAGEARSATEIDDHFQRNYGINNVTTACEYLADQGLIGKAPLSVRLTKRSNVAVEELAFFYTERVG
jgi:hypothetical protein